MTPSKSEGSSGRPVVPTSFDMLIERFQSVSDDAQSGQIWRARWNETAQLVALISVSDTEVVAVPVSFDVALADEHAVPLPLESVLGQGTVAWTSLLYKLPIRILDVLIGSTDASILAEDGIGATLINPLDERYQVRDEMVDRMEALKEAAWVPTTTEPVDIGDIMRARDLKPSQVARHVGVDPGVIVSLVRGDRTPTAEQATLLASILGITAAALAASHAIDSDLVWALDRPKFRKRLANSGRSNGVMDEGTWRYKVATSELATAARITGSKDARLRWIGLIEDYLRDH